MSVDEAAWVERAKAGDEAAFAALYARYERRLYGFICRLLGDPDEAADLTQETFLRAYRSLGATDAELNFGAWAHRIAANACLDLRRRRRRAPRIPWDSDLGDLRDERHEGDPEGALLGDEMRRAVRRTLGVLPPRQRRALVLREYEGRTYAEIGASLGLSLPAVKSTLFRAREAFRAAYLEVASDPEPAAAAPPPGSRPPPRGEPERLVTATRRG